MSKPINCHKMIIEINGSPENTKIIVDGEVLKAVKAINLDIDFTMSGIDCLITQINRDETVNIMPVHFDSGGGMP